MAEKSIIKLTVNQLITAVPIITTIIREKRPMPQKGKFNFARMYSTLLPHWNRLNTERDELIKSFDHHPMLRRAATPDDSEEDRERGYVEKASEEFSVPVDKMKDFEEQWKPIGEREVEVEVEPIPMKTFDLGLGSDGSVDAAEIIDLGPLITE